MAFMTTRWHRFSDVLNQERILRQMVAALFMLVIGIIFLSINRGIGFTDEAWYLVLLRDQVTMGGSSWPLFFTWLPDSPLLIRLATVGLIFLGVLPFGWGLYAFFKDSLRLPERSIAPIVMTGFIGAFAFGNAVSLVPCYYWLNHFMFSSGIGFALLSGRSGKTGVLWAGLSGFVFGLLVFVMPTNTPFVLFVLVFIMLTPSPWQRLIGFAIGATVAVILYFLVIQSPADLYLMVQKTLHDADSTHGIRPMLDWFKKSVLYMVNDILMVAVLIYLLRRFVDAAGIKREPITILVASLAIVLLTLIPYVCGLVCGTLYGINPAEPLAVVFVWMVLEAQDKLKLREWAALAALFVAPFFASLGTNVPFSVRGTMYMGTFYGAMGLLFVLSPSGARFRMYMSLLLGVMVLGFAINYFRPNWSTGISLSANTVPLSEVGIEKGIRVSPGTYGRIKEAREFVGSTKYAAINDFRGSWGFVYLLNLRPLVYNYNPREHDILMAIEASGENEIVLVEYDKKVFSRSFWLGINGKWQIQNARNIGNEFKFYKLRRV